MKDKFKLGAGGLLYAPPIAPDEVLDYPLDLTALLAGTTIQAVTWRATDITVDTARCSFTGTTVTVWLKEGIRGRTAIVTFTVITSNNDTFERTFNIAVKHL